jgi:2,3-dihydroxyphenylpropionate 1,2-dioxygenase
MAEVVAIGALSHSPLLNGATGNGLTAPIGVTEFRAAARALGDRIKAAKPDVVLLIGPDHFRSLFYVNMPAFCLGVGRVTGWGDWETRAGELPGKPAIARALHRTLLEADFDISSSYDLPIDHGLTQPLDLCCLPADLPIIPLIVNANAPPRPSLRRCFALGVALRKAIEDLPRPLRVAVIASGGLSHTPPAGDIESGSAETIERLIHGAARVREDESARVQQIRSSAPALAKGINAGWDRRLLARLEAGEGAALALELTDAAIDAEGGNGGHEIRAWFVAAGIAGESPFHTLSYAPIPELITGMSVAAFG